MALVSGKYILYSRDSKGASDVSMEHCALMEAPSQWVLDVKCRQGGGDWRSLGEDSPKARVKINRCDIIVTLPSLQEELEIAAFGKPGDKDMKRMQMAIFGSQPVKGRNWTISVHLFDDTVMAFENVYKKEKKKGNKLVAPRAGLFLSSNGDDVRIELGDLDPGWKIKGSNVKTMKCTDAWNSPENATDFQACRFEISHVDETKRSFFCVITASHGTDITKAEIMEVFKQEGETNDDEINESGETVKDVKVNDSSDVSRTDLRTHKKLCRTPCGYLGKIYPDVSHVKVLATVPRTLGQCCSLLWSGCSLCFEGSEKRY